MESFNENFTSKVTELNTNLSKFTNKSNNVAGTRARKNAQELKSMLQALRIEILSKQKIIRQKRKLVVLQKQKLSKKLLLIMMILIQSKINEIIKK